MSASTPIQRRFRYVNNEILDQSRPVSPFAMLGFVCECSDPSCFGVLPLTVSRFVRGTAGHDRYLVLAGHPTGDVSTLTSQTARAA